MMSDSSGGQRMPLLAPAQGDNGDHHAAMLATSPASRSGSPPFPRLRVNILLGLAVMQSYAQSCAQSVLAYYFHTGLKPVVSYTDNESTAFVNAFICVYSIFGVVGGYVGDQLYTNYSVELGAAVVWTLGAAAMSASVYPAVQLVLGAPSRAAVTLGAAFSGLSLTGMGYGVINSLQSVLVADQFESGSEQELVKVFAAYYLWCNVGNIMGEFGGPAMRYYVGYEVALMTVAVAMVLSTALFLVAGKYLRRVPPANAKKSLQSTSASVAESSASAVSMAIEGGHIPSRARQPHLGQRSGCCARWKAAFLDLAPVLRVFAPLPLFWALLYQQSSTWVFQGSQMSLRVPGTDPSAKVDIPPDIMPSLDDILCVVLIPTFQWWIYPACDRKLGRPVPILWRMAAGMVAVAVGFVICGVLQMQIDARHANGDAKLTILWQVPQYVFISAGEILVAVPGLEFAYSQAPPSTKNTVTALWGVTQACGSMLIATIANVDALNNAGTQVYFGYAVAMVAFLGLFLWLTHNYKYVPVKANH